MRLILAVALVLLAACQRQSPLDEMMKADARGEVACVRNDVPKRGQDCK